MSDSEYTPDQDNLQKAKVDRVMGLVWELRGAAYMHGLTQSSKTIDERAASRKKLDDMEDEIEAILRDYIKP